MREKMKKSTGIVCVFILYTNAYTTDRLQQDSLNTPKMLLTMSGFYMMR